MSADREAAIHDRLNYWIGRGRRLEAELAAAREALHETARKFTLAEEDARIFREREAKLREALRPIIHEYNLWAEDATDGEFLLWDLDRLVMAIVNARALADGEGET